MRRYIGYALLLIAFITVIVWAISQFVQPVLPSNINNGLILFFVALISTIGAIAGFKDTIELFGLFSNESNDTQRKLQHNLPQPPYERFIGRQEELTQIHKLLSPISRHFVITIDGVGGVGKTSLALESAYFYLEQQEKLSKRARFQVIIWSTAKREVLTGEGIVPQHQSFHTVEDIYSAIAAPLNRQDILEAPIDQQDDLIRHALTQKRTLLIVDNLETVDDERLLSFLKDIPAPTKVIVTTRHRIDVAYPIRLLGMKEDDAEDLIKDECNKRGVRLTVEETKKLIRRTGGIPLAIVWSIAQMGFGYTPEVILNRLGHPNNDLAKFCFQGVMDQIRGQSSYKLLMALTYLENNVDRQKLGEVAGLPELERDDGLIMLEKLSLVNKKGDIFEALPLTLTFCKSELRENATTWLELTKPYLDNYIKLIRTQYGFSRILGQFTPVSIEDSFIEVYVFPRPKFQQGTNQLPSLNPRSDFPGGTKNAIDVIKQENKLFILGNPGTGKTTFLKYVALHAVDSPLNKIPVFIGAKELADSNVSVFEFITNSFSIARFPSPNVYVTQLLETGNAVLLFDGLDEVSQLSQLRDEVLANIEHFANLYPSCQYIITSRVATINRFLEGFTYVELSEFGSQEVKDFAQKWFSDPQVSTLFLKEIERKENKSLSELTRNPLLLNLLCVVYEELRTFPQRRVEIFEEAVDALLKKWDSSRNIRRDQAYRFLSLGRKRQLLSKIATETFEKESFLIPRIELEQLILDYFRIVPNLNVEEIEPTAILHTIEAQHGILIERAEGMYSFNNLAFHEYFTARYIADQYMSGRGEHQVGLLFVHITDSRWYEVFRLIISMLTDGDDFLQLFLHRLAELLNQSDKVVYYLKLNLNKHLAETPLNELTWDVVRATTLSRRNQAKSKLTKKDTEQLLEYILVCDLFWDCLKLAAVSNRKSIEHAFWTLGRNESETMFVSG